MSAPEAITFTEGYLSFTDVRGTPKLVEEVSMARYEHFFKLWHVAMQAAFREDKSRTFTYNWVWNQEFREAMEKALLVFDLQADDLTPSQLHSLLFSSGEGKPGLLFQLHNDIPGEVQEEKKRPEPKPKRLGWHKRLRQAVSTRLDSTLSRAGLAWQVLTSSPLESASG